MSTNYWPFVKSGAQYGRNAGGSFAVWLAVSFSYRNAYNPLASTKSLGEVLFEFSFYALYGMFLGLIIGALSGLLFYGLSKDFSIRTLRHLVTLFAVALFVLPTLFFWSIHSPRPDDVILAAGANLIGIITGLRARSESNKLMIDDRASSD